MSEPMQVQAGLITSKSIEARTVDRRLSHCSFCGRSSDHARGMVEGDALGRSAFICLECVGKCAQLVAQQLIPRSS